MDQDMGDFADALEPEPNAESREKFRQQRRVLDGRVFVGLPFEQFRPGEGMRSSSVLQSFFGFLNDARLSAFACAVSKSSLRTGSCSPSSSLPKEEIEARAGAMT
jgi:hypothetical protein